MNFSLPSTHLPRFQGRQATTIATETHQSGQQLAALLQADSDPYIGQSPDNLRTQTAMEETPLRLALDALAHRLRKRPNSAKQGLRKLNAPEPFTSQSIRKAGQGRMGQVYKLGETPNAFALKVFRHPSESMVEEREIEIAPFQETANGLFLTHRNTRNVSKFYLANPSKGWTLMEYISRKNNLNNRSGKTLDEQNLFLTDTGNPANFINGIRVDHGDHLHKKSQSASTVWLG
jgi:hypothetical protein